MEKQINYKSMELQNENEKLKEEKKEIGQLKRKIIEQEEEITKLVGENQEMKETMAIMKAYMKKKRFSIPYHVLPAELLNELFASLTFENAFGLLVKMPNGLLARNIQKMINCIREAMSNNKLNEKDCGPRLSISENGFIVKHAGPEKWNCVRAVLPIPSFNFKGINKATIAFYFEMQILHKENGIGRIGIGFCDEQFSLEGRWPGFAENSAGFESKLGIWIENIFPYFQNYEQHFDKGDFVGIGIIHLPNSKMECFATWNGVLLNKIIKKNICKIK